MKALDPIIKAIKHEISSNNRFRTFPQQFVTENFKGAVIELPVERFASSIGMLCAHKLDLGGEEFKHDTDHQGR